MDEQGLAPTAVEGATYQDDDLLDAAALPMLELSVGTLVAVFVGGALGTLARYLLEATHPAGTAGFPWVTLGVNLSGSFAIGLVVVLTERTPARWRLGRPLVVVGFLGGWTTYSTLAVEAVLLGSHDKAVFAMFYLVATLGGGVLLVVAGHWAGRRLTVR